MYPLIHLRGRGHAGRIVTCLNYSLNLRASSKVRAHGSRTLVIPAVFISVLAVLIFLCLIGTADKPRSR